MIGLETEKYIPKNLKINKKYIKQNIFENIFKKDQDVDTNIISSLTIYKRSNTSEENIIFCTYSKLFILNVKENIINELKKPKEVKDWFPTGVKYNKKNDLLYVANYLGKNVLVFKLIEKKSKDMSIHCNFEIFNLKLVEELTHGMVGPENLDITNNGKYLAVADYVNSSIFLFKYIDGKHIKLWSVTVGFARGISFSPDENSIIASGLIPPTIYKFDIESNLIKSIGSSGWEKDNYLWPTCISRYIKNLVVSDAHHGKITIIDSDLNTINCFGGNGIGIDLFNMPYGIEYDHDDEKLYIADTFKKRILILNSEFEIISIFDNFNQEINKEEIRKASWKPDKNEDIICTKNYKLLGNTKINEEVFVEVYFSLYKERIDISNGMSIPKILGFNDIIEFNIKDEIKNWIPNKLYNFHKIFKTTIKSNNITLDLLHSEHYYKYSNNGITLNVIPSNYKDNYFLNNTTIMSSEPMYEGYVERINKNLEYSIVFDNFNFDNKKYNPSYHSLVSNDKSKIINLDGTINLVTFLYYWVNILNISINNDNIIILGSPQCPNFILIYKDILFTIKLDYNYWIYNNKIITTYGKELIISKKIFEIKNKYIKILADIEDKKDPIDILCTLYLFSIKEFKTLFKSNLGKKLIDELEEIYGSDDIIDIKYNRYYAIAKIYLDNIKDDKIYYITEISVANFLMKCKCDLKTNIIYKFLKKKFQIDKDMDKNKLLLKLRNIVYQTTFTKDIDNKNSIRKNINFLYHNGIVCDYLNDNMNDILVLFLFNYLQKTYCQISQIIYIFLLSLFNIKSRPVALCYYDKNNNFLTHATVECYYDGKYIISDPHFAISLKKNNKYLCFKELHNLYINNNCNNIIEEMSCEIINNGNYTDPNSVYSIRLTGLMNNIILKDEAYILDNNDKIKYWIKFFQNLYKTDFYLSLIKL